MIELGRRDLYQQISGFDLAADIDVALGDVAARARVNVGLRESFRGARPRNRHDGAAGPHPRRAERIKEGAIPIISDVEGFMGYYARRHGDSDQYLQRLCRSRRVEQAGAGVDRLAPLLAGPATAIFGPVIVHTLA